MVLPVFKTGEAEYLGLAGSIPVRLRIMLTGRFPVTTARRRDVPRTDTVLDDPALAEHRAKLGRDAVKRAVTAVLARIRAGEIDAADAVPTVHQVLASARLGPQRVLNATGVVIHTNLGRAPLSEPAVEAIRRAAGYADIEFDLESGRRGSRNRGLDEAIEPYLPDGIAALAVNNGAAALLLATTAFSAGREVVISRGEMVEVGDGFRLPDLIESTGARLREVGTTNRTTLDDYRRAIGPDTGCVLKVHPSNFRIEGFTSAVPTAALATLGIPVVVDIGSGLLAPDPLLPGEPDARTTLAAGATAVTFSGDKLLGGPQAGLLLGSRETVQRMRRHPLARALRMDKLTLAALEATLRRSGTPVWEALRADGGAQRDRCEAIVAGLGIPSEVVPSVGAVGGGSAPGHRLAGWAVSLPPEYAAALRMGDPPVVGRIEHGRCLLDLRCIPPHEDACLVSAITAAHHRLAGTS